MYEQAVVTSQVEFNLAGSFDDGVEGEGQIQYEEFCHDRMAVQALVGYRTD